MQLEKHSVALSVLQFYMYTDYTGSTSFLSNIVFMHELLDLYLNFQVQLLGIYGRRISDTVRHVYCRINEVLFDFSCISCDSKFRLA